MNNSYPENWPEIAETIKRKNNYRCERCKSKAEGEGESLGVHHLDGDKSNCEDWNLACLCNRCHLKIQARIKMDQMFWENFLPVSDWFKPHLEGYLKSKEGNGGEG